MSKAGMKHVQENYNFETFEKQWIDFIDKTIEYHGSWETSLGYRRVLLALAGSCKIILLHVPKGERNFDLTYLRAPWAVGIIIAYLSFSAI